MVRDRRGDSEHPTDKRDGVRPLQVAKSVLAAAFGVQTPAARERDFSKGNPFVFLVAGLVFTIVFILALVVIVNLVLTSAGV